MNIETLPCAVFFDWDGTLVDSFGFILSAHQHARKALGLPDFSGEEFEEYFGKQRDEIYQGIYGETMLEAKPIYEAYISEKNKTHLRPMPEAQPLLEYAKQLGLTLGVVSNKKSEFLKDEIGNFGWDQYFDAVVGAGEANRDKPYPDPLLLAMERAGGCPDPKTVWYVGDTNIDIQCAKAAGCKPVLISKKTDVSEIQNIPMIVENCLHLHEFLLQCAEKSLKRGL